MTVFGGIWLGLFVIIVGVRKYHERRAGSWSSLKDTPFIEAVLMVLWGVAIGIVPFLYIFSNWIDFANWPFQSNIFGGLGALLFVISIWLLHRSHVDLGGAWSSEISPKYSLVTNGVYSNIRHPMYSAHLLWCIAQCLMLANWLAGCLPLILLIVLLFLRIPREERALVAQFGDRYQVYSQKTGRLFPKL